MNIEYSNIITLSDKKEYVVAGKTVYNDYEYLFLVDLHDNKNTKVVWLRGNQVIELDTTLDIELINVLLPKFLNSVKEFIESLD